MLAVLLAAMTLPAAFLGTAQPAPPKCWRHRCPHRRPHRYAESDLGARALALRGVTRRAASFRSRAAVAEKAATDAWWKAHDDVWHEVHSEDEFWDAVHGAQEPVVLVGARLVAP